MHLFLRVVQMSRKLVLLLPTPAVKDIFQKNGITVHGAYANQ